MTGEVEQLKQDVTAGIEPLTYSESCQPYRHDANANVLCTKTNLYGRTGREQEISAIEARVKKLRDQLRKRRDAKGQIFDHQMKSIELEADGLGLFQTQKPGNNARHSLSDFINGMSRKPGVRNPAQPLSTPATPNVGHLSAPTDAGF